LEKVFALLSNPAPQADSMGTLELNTEYPILYFTLLATKYGPRVIACLPEKSVFLPKRFSDTLASAETIAVMNGSALWYLRYRGRDADHNNMILMDLFEKPLSEMVRQRLAEAVPPEQDAQDIDDLWDGPSTMMPHSQHPSSSHKSK
jgi:hypothetical protein